MMKGRKTGKYEQKSYSIKCWPKNERPRESLLEQGAGSLSDAGLLAVLIGTGSIHKDAVSLSRELLTEFGGFRGLFNATPENLMKTKGFGASKTARLLAVFEIAKRHQKERIINKKYVSNDKEVMDYLVTTLRDRQTESFYTIYLNKALAILDIALIHSGSVDRAVVYPREVLKKAIQLDAAAVIFVHNHPAGTPRPGPEDIHLTKKLFNASRALGVKPLDHLIITGDSYISMKAQKAI